MTNRKFCVIGLGYFGLNLSIYLTQHGAEVIAIDNKEDRIELLKDKVAIPVKADATDIKVLKDLGIQEMDAVIVAIGEGFEASINALASLQELGVKKIFARVISPIHEKLVKLMNVTEILYPEAEAAQHLANRLIIPELIDIIDLDKNYAIFETLAPNDFIGKKLMEVNLRERHHLNLITVKHEFKRTAHGLHEGNIIGTPSPEYKFKSDDVLVLFGEKDDISKFLKKR